MKTLTTHTSGMRQKEDVILAILRQAGPQTLDSLSSATSLEWGQTFSIVDRLSRAGVIALRQCGRGEYRVSLGQSAR
jgi:predicted transcriptional regulator